MLQSRRACSWRQLIDVLRAVTQLLQLPGPGVVLGKSVDLEGQEAPGAEPVLRDPVAGEPVAGKRIDRRGRGAVLDAGPAEVPRALGGRGDEGGPRETPLLPVPLLGHEEVNLVLDDRTAQGPPEVVNAQGRLRLAGLLEEVVRRGQLLVSAEVVAAAMELVGPAASDDVHLGSRCPAELGAVAVPMHLELVD